jgi:hypothetical protein
MREVMWPLAFWTWLISLKLMFSSSIHLPINDKILFFSVAEYNFIVNKYHTFLIHFSVVENPGCFHSLAILNHAAINMGVQVPLL